jgi:O-succinylbenzoic acid--CoA ligase
VLHALSAHRAAAAGAAERVPFGPGDRWLLSLPICHVGGLALLARALHRGGAIALPAPGQSLVDAVVAHRPTHLSIVAAQLRALVASAAACEALSSAQAVLVGGGPTPSSLLELGLARGLPLRQTWGLTEMGSQVCTSPLRQPSTCGAPLPGRTVRIADDGELVVSGAGRCSGFVDGETITYPFDDDGAYATGDLGRFENDGASGVGLIIVGRKDLMFISGGENIQPEVVAAALSDVDVSVIVVPVADARFGARPFAFFAGGDDRHDDDVRRTLQARAEAALPRFMHPVGYVRLPQQSGLKPRRSELVAAAQERMDAMTSSPSSSPSSLLTSPLTSTSTSTHETTTTAPRRSPRSTPHGL